MKGITEVDPREILTTGFITNCTDEIRDNDVSELIASIKERGLINPLRVRVTRVSEGGNKVRKYHLITGFRRLKAILAIKDAEPDAFGVVPCTIFEGTETDALMDNLAENLDREDVRPMQVAQRVVELKRLGVNVDRIVERVKISKQHLYNLVSIYNSAAKEIRDLYDQGEISFNDAVTLKALPEEQQKAAAEKIKAEPKKKAQVVKEATGKTKARGKTELQEKLDDIPAAGANDAQKAARSVLQWALGEIDTFPKLN